MAKLNDIKVEKVVIHNKDENSDFEAYYNPKEISVDRSVPWNKHKLSKGDTHVLEFTNAEPMTLSFELFFDTYETKGNVYTEYVGSRQLKRKTPRQAQRRGFSR